jgi:hypothetical protein
MRFDAFFGAFSRVMPGQTTPGAVFKREGPGIARAAPAGLTMRQRARASCIDPEQASALHQFKTTARLASAAVRIR